MKCTERFILQCLLASLLFTNLLPLSATAKTVDNSSFKIFIESRKTNNASTEQIVHQYKMLYTFYEHNNFSPKWFSNIADSGKRNSLQYLLANADLFALRPGGFHYTSLSSKKIYNNLKDTFAAEVMYTDAALSFMHDLAYGGDYNFVRYNGLKYHPGHLDLISALNNAFNKENFISQLTFVEPNGDKFTCMKEEYLWLLAVYKSPGFTEITVKSKEVKLSNTNLVKKLAQLGYMTVADSTENDLMSALEQLQRQHNLLVQNKINVYCLEVLNQTIAYRLEELIWNIKWYRWLNGMKDKPHIVVNIPSNRLTYYEQGISKMESRMVVGKISTPTPTLTSEIKNVIYYPYWNVPHSIAVKEMLPTLKMFPGYLQKLNLEVLLNGRIVSGVNWHGYSSSNFPFQLRQKPGCNNALGRLKFEFENPFHVYLHDTNSKLAFLAGKRYFSHGCMRIEKPYELAVLLGVDSTKIDMTECLENKKPQVIPLANPVAVFVIYASIDFVNGQMQWHEDAYHKIRTQKIFNRSY